MPIITLFRNIKDTANPVHVELSKSLERIRTGKYKELINQIRKEKNKEQRNILKQQLPSILFSGQFRSRRADAITAHSGLICLDFDNIPSSKLKSIREELIQNQYVHALFLSPGGEGFKVIVRIPPEIQNHKSYFDGLANHFASPYFDKNTSDICRVCYESYDPKLYYNENSIVFTDLILREQYTYAEKHPDLPITNQNDIYQRLLKWLEKNGDYFVSGNRNQFIFKLASACCRYGIEQNVAEMLMSGFIETNFNESELFTTISQGYKANQSAFGTEYFEDNQAIKVAKELLRKGSEPNQVAKTLSDMRGIEHTKAQQIVNKVQQQKEQAVTQFWTISYNKNGTPSVKINRGDYIEWLHNQGIYRYKYSLKHWELIHIVNNVVQVINKADLKKIVFDWIKDEEIVYEYFASIVKSIFSDDILELLEERKVEFLKDNVNRSTFYFKNKIVTVSKDNIEFSDYEDIEGCIWKSQIIDRDWTGSNNIKSLDDGMNSDFAKFLFNVSGQDVKRLGSMMSAVGFLLHNYKSRRECPAVILNDETISDNPEGGTGKGIFIRALQQYKQTTSVDGKVFKFEKSFLYQRVSLETQLLAFEDVQQGFDFERLFSVITDGIEVEKKGKDAFYIPFEQSPKIILTTNYAVSGYGNSHNRRKFELEFAQHYNKQHTPVDEFGKILFDDWSEAEWALFDKFMLACSHIYLSKGLIDVDHVNLEYKKLVASTSIEFVEFMEDRTLSGLIQRTDLHKSFIDEYENMKKFCPPRKFKRWVDIYCKHNDIKYENVKSNGLRYYNFYS